ncbi:MAG TPA: hypothetical protein VF108_01855 [Actinomycetota bacterium]
MRRVLAIVAVSVALGSCGTGTRAEGVVERWLQALNQGSAGRPSAYARPELSERILPGFERVDPGELDVIEVGRGTPGCGVAGWFVPFRVVRLDGTDVRSVACTDMGSVAELFPPSSENVPRDLEALPSEGGPPIGGVDPTAWAAALVVAIALAAAAEVGVRLARKPGG